MMGLFRVGNLHMRAGGDEACATIFGGQNGTTGACDIRYRKLADVCPKERCEYKPPRLPTGARRMI